MGIGRSLIAAGREQDAFQHYMETGIRFGRGELPWQAIVVLTEAVILQPENPDAQHALGSARLVVGRNDTAIEQFRKAVSLDPAKVESWYNLGLAADRLDFRDEAIDAYNRFIAIAPASLGQQVARAQERIAALRARVTDQDRAH